jgi:hypothetical protein
MTQNTIQKSISIVFLRKALFVMIRHSASTVNRSSRPLEIFQMAHVQGVTASVYGTCWVTNHDE